MRRNGLGDCSSDCTYFLVRTSSWKCIAGFAAALALHSSLLRRSFALPEAQPEMLETFMTFMQLESFCKDHVRFIWWDAMQLLRFSRHVGNDMLYVVTSMLWSVSWKDSPEADDKLCGRCTAKLQKSQRLLRAFLLMNVPAIGCNTVQDSLTLATNWSCATGQFIQYQRNWNALQQFTLCPGCGLISRKGRS